MADRVEGLKGSVEHRPRRAEREGGAAGRPQSADIPQDIRRSSFGALRVRYEYGLAPQTTIKSNRELRAGRAYLDTAKYLPEKNLQ